MASTHTTNLGIEKIEVGQQDGTWGTTTNTNFDLLDTAIGGQVTLTVPATGSTGTPNDYDIPEGSAGDGRNIFIEFSDGGDLGGTAYARITPNDAEKILFVRNSLTASRSIIIFQGTYDAAKDVVLAAGTDAIIKFDGAGTGATTSLMVDNLALSTVTASGAVTGGSFAGLPVAGPSTAGIVELATSAETNTGTDATRAVTPDGLEDWEGSAQVTTLGTIATGTWQGTIIAEAYLPNASATAEGVVELATQAEVDAGTDTTRVVTADTLTNFAGFPGSTAASTTVAGIVELATIAETNTGTDTTRAVTPDGLDGWTGSAQVTTLGTLVGTTFGAEIVETVFAIPSSTTPELDPADGTIQTWTLTGTSTPTDVLVSGESITLGILDGSANTIVWTSVLAAADWVGGSAPTLSLTGTTWVEFWHDGTHTHGALIGFTS